jgi:hypothetical protein
MHKSPAPQATSRIRKGWLLDSSASRRMLGHKMPALPLSQLMRANPRRACQWRA